MNEQEPDPDETIPFYRVNRDGLTMIVHFSEDFLSQPEKDAVVKLIEHKKERQALEELGIGAREYRVRIQRIKARIHERGFTWPGNAHDIIFSLQSLKALDVVILPDNPSS